MVRQLDDFVIDGEQGEIAGYRQKAMARRRWNMSFHLLAQLLRQRTTMRAFVVACVVNPR
jgi:hypothetical protein